MDKNIHHAEGGERGGVLKQFPNFKDTDPHMHVCMHTHTIRTLAAKKGVLTAGHCKNKTSQVSTDQHQVVPRYPKNQKLNRCVKWGHTKPAKGGQFLDLQINNSLFRSSSKN